MQVINTLLFIGAAQGFFLSVTLYSISRGNKKANRILATLLLIFSIMIFFHSMGDLTEKHVTRDKHQSQHQAEAVFFVFGPLFYFYAKALTDRTFKLALKSTLHLLPFVLYLAFYNLLLQISSANQLIHITNISIPWIMMLQMSLYLFLVFGVLKTHNQKIRTEFSSIERINLNWLRFLTFAQLIIWPIAFIAELYGGGSEVWNFIWILISILMYLIGYLGLRQPEIFTGKQELLTEQNLPPKKYRKSTLTEENAVVYFKRLQDFMASEKPHFDSDLTLPTLAKKLGISVHHLSQVINEKTGQNFYEFVNSYRIEEAKTMLRDPEKQNYNIASIGFDVGFNSISAFNSIFKKQTGVTPSQYRSAETSL